MPSPALALSVVFLALCPLASNALETRMTWRVGEDTVFFEEKVLPTASGYSAVLTTSVGEYDSLVLDRRRSTTTWRRRVASENTDIIAERTGSQVRVRGSYKGKPYEKTHEIGDLPWFQLHEVSYEDLYASGLGDSRFWTIDRKTLKPTEFRAQRGEAETIVIGGKAVAAISYSLTVSGVPSFIFHSRFWLRKSDGRFLRLEAPAILGLPRSSVELTAEF